MPRINKDTSVILSLILSALFMLALIAACVIYPVFVNVFYAGGGVPHVSRALMLSLGYLAFAAAMTADTLLIALLLRVKKGLVFTDITVALIRRVSWCSFFVGALFAVLGFVNILSFVISFAAVLLGLCLRVVKNVIEEAMAIKSENDLTV